ncbi:MAG: metalloregulator ArsR/SmtB family transcription factor [Verrucomicrobiota bacterium]
MECATTNDWIPILKALADETRLGIVRQLLEGPCGVGELSERLEVSNYNISKHLRVLCEAELVVTHKHGKAKNCELADEFRKKLEQNENVLDLGCCTFRFDDVPS